tara:strand:- start:1459 stop:1665 length:207 start_codon:yes stop_codon:yes gene_type:complete
MKIAQKLLNKAIESERTKIIHAFAADPLSALEQLLVRCGVKFQRTDDSFVICTNSTEDVIITVKKQTK